MFVWFITSHGSPPQHIGSTDGNTTSAELISAAHKARHTTVKFCAKAIKGNDVKYYMFDDAESMVDFQMCNTDLAWQDVAAA